MPDPQQSDRSDDWALDDRYGGRPTVTQPERHDDGVFWEDGCWNAYYGGNLVACGPDKPIIQAAYDNNASADEYRSGPDDGVGAK